MSNSNLTLGKYRILEELGHGGFATVFKAEDTTLERIVALKVLDPVLTREVGLISRFQQEAKITARLFHPNIAALFEVGQDNGRYFLAMQYIPGRNLRDRMQAGGLLPLDQIAAILPQIGAALDYAHAQGVIHRDVKPSNILVDDAQHATLTDFGIVKVFEGATLQTTSGAILGTPAYSSPEQVDSKPLDHRSDLYSLGVVIYELCVGKVPFEADTVPSLYYKIAHETPPAPSQVQARAAGPLETVLVKALAKDREQRYQSGTEFAAAFKAAVEQVTGAYVINLYREAQTLQQQGDLDGAEDRLRQVLAIQPDHTGARALLISISQQRDTQQRYARLSEQIKVARIEAQELQQSNLALDDRDGVLSLLTETRSLEKHSPGTPQSASVVKPQSAKSSMLSKIVLGGLVGMALIAFAISFIMFQPVSADNRLQLYYALQVSNGDIGQFALGLGVGLLVALGVVLVVQTIDRKSH